MEELTYPNRVNTEGMPTLLGTPSVEGTTLTITFKPHLVPNEKWSGAFWVSVNGTIAATTTATQNVVFATEGDNRVPTPLYLYSGTQATNNNLATTVSGSVFECFYNADTQRLQLVGML